MLLGKLFDNTLNYTYVEIFFLLYICYMIIVGVMINNNSVYYYSKSLVKLNKLSNFVILIMVFIIYFCFLNNIDIYLFFLSVCCEWGNFMF